MIAVLLCALALVDVRGAEEAYRAGRYAEAYEGYRDALGNPDLDEGALLFDMGNCAFRLERFADAAWLYRRAALRRPGDPSVEFNLRWTEEQLGITRPAEDSLASEVLGSLARLSLAVVLTWSVVLQGVGLAGLLLGKRGSPLRAAAAVAVVVGALAALRAAQLQWSPRAPMAVVTASEVRVRPEPHNGFASLFELDAGATVVVEEQSDRWLRVRCERGSGWTERVGLGLVD